MNSEGGFGTPQSMKTAPVRVHSGHVTAGKEAFLNGLRAIWRNVTAFFVSEWTWQFNRTTTRRYRAQAHVVAAWVVREVRRTLRRGIPTDLDWELDLFQLFLASGIYRELVKNQGYYPISNSPLLSPTALFEQAIREARIHPPEPVILALPHVRIRIVPGWVKVYGVSTPMDAPTVLYPEKYARKR
jgi:hypothetical protein